MKATKESSKERKESKESKKAVVVAEALKTTTSAGAREYPKDQPLEVVKEADLQYFVEVFNGEMCRMQAVIPAIDTLDSVCRHQLRTLLRKYPMAKLEKMATMAAESDFLNNHGRKPFLASVEWLLREENFIKVINGNYDNTANTWKPRDPIAEMRKREEEQRRYAREIEREEHERRMRQREEWAKGAVTYEEYQRMKAEGRMKNEE